MRRGLQKSNLAILQDLYIYVYICGVVSINVAPMAGWLMENPIQMDDLGGTHHFRKSPYQFTRDFLVEAGTGKSHKFQYENCIPGLVNKQLAIENGHRNSGFSH